MKQLSKLFTLNVQDLLKGFLIAALTVVLTGVITTLKAGSLPDMAMIEHLITAGLGAGLAYILKNLFTNSQNQFATPEPPAK
jgi:hypothetical protein